MTNVTTISTRLADADDDDVAPAARLSPTGIASVLIIEPDADCADALEMILADLPGIEAVQTAITPRDALDLIAGDAGMALERAATASPDIIFIGACQPDPAAIEMTLLETLATVRHRVPDASIVLLCVYPERFRQTLRGLVDRCVRKDTSARELRALIEELRAGRAAA